MKRILSIAIAVILLLSTFFASAPAAAEGSTSSLPVPVIKKVKTYKYNPKITWEAAEGAVLYRIYRKTPTDSGYTEIAETDKLTYTDKTWTADEGTKIAYKVKAMYVTEKGESWSKASSAKKWSVKKVHVTATGVSSPESLKSGRSFSLKGTISVDAGVLTKVTGKITGTDGKEYYARTEKPDKAKFSISGSQIDNALKFGSLKDGSYVYTVTVETTYSKAEEVIKAEFTVGTATPVPTATPTPEASNLEYIKDGKIYFEEKKESRNIFLLSSHDMTDDEWDYFKKYVNKAYFSDYEKKELVYDWTGAYLGEQKVYDMGTYVLYEGTELDNLFHNIGYLFIWSFDYAFCGGITSQINLGDNIIDGKYYFYHSVVYKDGTIKEVYYKCTVKFK